MITTLLIANRGEIACRIIQTCQRLGIRTVAVFSTADRNALHVHQADEAVALGAATPTESYLNQAAILEAARRTGAQAIHPGYGFLAENALFARACAEAGLIFIGPSPTAIELMGNKRIAKQTVAAAGVPSVPGSPLDEILDDQALQTQAEQLGFPVMIKAAAGGGGLGMRMAHNDRELAESIPGARRDALAAFGSAEVLLERAIIEPRHIEVQIFGDEHGNIVHLGERECSIQRRHQKIIEEAPASGLNDDVRQQLHTAAVLAAQAINYTNAGTVEFLVDAEQHFYFLEVNTRLQVEHPVTELITGLDLVEWQIRIAEGERLPLLQNEISFNGHAIEARVYAEDPQHDFRPASGPIALWKPAQHIRVDSGMQTGDTITVFYDPMVAKIIAWDKQRTGAARKLAYALEATSLLGTTSNLKFLAHILRQPAFLQGQLSTAYLQQHGNELFEAPSEAQISTAITMLTAVRWQQTQAQAWRNNPGQPTQFGYSYIQQPITVQLEVPKHSEHTYRLSWIYNNQHYTSIIDEIEVHQHQISITQTGHRTTATWAKTSHGWWIDLGTVIILLNERSLLPQPRRTADTGGSLRAPMPGTILKILVEVGQHIEPGSPLLTLEAMKMEHTLRTDAAGIVSNVFYNVGDSVEADAILVAIEEDD